MPMKSVFDRCRGTGVSPDLIRSSVDSLPFSMIDGWIAKRARVGVFHLHPTLQTLNRDDGHARSCARVVAVIAR